MQPSGLGVQPPSEQATRRISIQEAASIPSRLPPAASLCAHLGQDCYGGEKPLYDYHQYPAMAQQQQQSMQRQYFHQHQHQNYHQMTCVNDYVGMPCNMEERMTSHPNHMLNHLPLSIEETLAKLPYNEITLHRALSTHSGQITQLKFTAFSFTTYSSSLDHNVMLLWPNLYNCSNIYNRVGRGLRDLWKLFSLEVV